jgi:hypothetical protein
MKRLAINFVAIILGITAFNLVSAISDVPPIQQVVVLFQHNAYHNSTKQCSALRHGDLESEIDLGKLLYLH